MSGMEIVHLALDAASWGLVVSGGLLMVVGGIGLVRLPDFYTRLHAGGVIDTLGADLILLGMALQAGFSLVTAKLVLIALFLFFTSPTSTHAAANAAYFAGLRPWTAEDGGSGKAGEPGEGAGGGTG